jgi:hypothetical protein
MLSTPPALIAVVGPVEPALLAAWVRHYRDLGIDRFLIAFHFPEHVAASGHLPTWQPPTGLDLAYPFGGHLTHRLLRGDPRKIVLARHEVAVASGNHRAPGHRPDADRLCAVHHFKWRSGVLDDLRRRVQHFAAGTWQEHTPAVRDEAGRLLAHVREHGGVINVSDPRFAFRRVSLETMPHSWPAEARAIYTAWRPPAHTRRP